MSHHGNDLAYEQRWDLWDDTFNKFMQERARLVELISQIYIDKYTQEEYQTIVKNICERLAEAEALEAVNRDIEKADYIREEQEWDAREHL